MKRATLSARRVFNEYLREKDESEPKTKEEICNVLKLFYVEARKQMELPIARTV